MPVHVHIAQVRTQQSYRDWYGSRQYIHVYILDQQWYRPFYMRYCYLPFSSDLGADRVLQTRTSWNINCDDSPAGQGDMVNTDASSAVSCRRVYTCRYKPRKRWAGIGWFQVNESVYQASYRQMQRWLVTWRVLRIFLTLHAT